MEVALHQIGELAVDRVYIDKKFVGVWSREPGHAMTINRQISEAEINALIAHCNEVRGYGPPEMIIQTPVEKESK